MMARVKTVLIALVCSGGLTACVSTGGGNTITPPVFGNSRSALATEAATGLSELPPQTLAAGACATFFWSADSQNNFLAFENETEGYSNVFANGTVHGFYIPPREGNYVAGDVYRRTYVDPARDLDIQVAGTIGDPLPTGQRIERVVMRVNQPNGQTLVVPMIGYYACRDQRHSAQ